MYHYTYEVSTSNPTDARQKYIGVRSSECYPTEDSYYGSCKSFTEWQKVNGNESLAKKIFAIHQTRELAMEHEIKLHELFDVGVNEEYFNQAKATYVSFYREPEVISKDVKRLWQDPEYREMMVKAATGKTISVAHRKAVSKALKGKPKSPEHIRNASQARCGFNHSDDAKQRMSQGHKGRIWVTNGTTTKSVYPSEIPEGFIKGRKL